jgi:hypothetical protein
VTDTSALSLVDSVVDAYSQLRSYQDAGEVRTWNDRTKTLDRFATHFISPEHYRFDYLATHPFQEIPEATIYHAIVANASGVFSYTHLFDSLPVVAKQESMAMAIAKLTGESMGAAYVVPRLLLKGVAGPTLREFEGIRLLEDAVVGGVECKQLACRTPLGQCVIAIEKVSRLIRRIYNRGADFEVEEMRTRLSGDRDVDKSIFDQPVTELLR